MAVTLPRSAKVERSDGEGRCVVVLMVPATADDLWDALTVCELCDGAVLFDSITNPCEFLDSGHPCCIGCQGSGRPPRSTDA